MITKDIKVPADINTNTNNILAEGHYLWSNYNNGHFISRLTTILQTLMMYLHAHVQRTF